MSLQEQFEKLQSDFSNLDMENVGGWPLPVKFVCWIIAMAAVVLLSYQLVLKEQRLELDREASKELSLRGDFEKKVQDAANIDAYRQQMVEMTDAFSTLLAQLPKDTEVPGLLDDITNKGQESGLGFQAIDLLQEKKADFYVELPISIKVRGGFHDFGAFVSGVAGLPRIVTLHDFVIQSVGSGKSGQTNDQRGSEELSMSITAKTYRYKSAEEDSGAKQKNQQKQKKQKK